MTNPLHETLSALMDNEADELELRRLLKEMAALDPARQDRDAAELKAKWYRYHVVSASLKQEIHTSPSRNLLAAIQSELQADPVPLAETRPAGGTSARPILRILGQGAIAASMALAVLFTADMVMVADTDTGAGAAVIADNDAGALRGITGELNPATETRLAIQNGLGDDEYRRLERVVAEELEDTLDNQEVPAIFVPEESR